MPSKSNDEEITIHITIEFEEEETYQPSAIDVAAHNFTQTINYYVIGFIILFIIGSIGSLFS